jgi:hypothetical protein
VMRAASKMQVFIRQYPSLEAVIDTQRVTTNELVTTNVTSQKEPGSLKSVHLVKAQNPEGGPPHKANY